MIGRFHTQPAAFPPRSFIIHGEQTVSFVGRVYGNTDHEIGVGKRVVFRKETGMGNAPGEDEYLIYKGDDLCSCLVVLASGFEHGR